MFTEYVDKIIKRLRKKGIVTKEFVETYKAECIQEIENHKSWFRRYAEAKYNLPRERWSKL